MFHFRTAKILFFSEIRKFKQDFFLKIYIFCIFAPKFKGIKR